MLWKCIQFRYWMFVQQTCNVHLHGIGQPANANLAENNMIGGVTVYADSTHFSLDNPATLKKLNYVQYPVAQACFWF